AAAADLPSPAFLFGVIAAAARAAAVQEGQFAAEPLQHDFGGVFLHAALVGPFAGLQLALHVNLGALLQILLGHPGQILVEDHHGVPLRLLLALAARLVAPALRGRDAQVHDRLAAV